MDRWLHEILDIVIWGRSYWQLHKEIDNPAKEWGIYHRIYNHDWYQEFKKSWDWENPFPGEKLNREIPEILEIIPNGLRETFSKLVSEEMRLHGEKGTVREAFAAYITHCFFDRLWDESPPEQRKYIEKFCVAWIVSPRLLYKAGIDINSWKIEREGDREVWWEDSPGLERDYKNLIDFIIRQGIFERLFGGHKHP